MSRTYRLADRTIQITSLYDEVHAYCAATTREDVALEGEKSAREDALAGVPRRRFSDEYLETIFVPLSPRPGPRRTRLCCRIKKRPALVQRASNDGGSSLSPDLTKGGLPDEYIRNFTTLSCHHRHLQPVHSGIQKEVTAGTLESNGGSLR